MWSFDTPGAIRTHDLSLRISSRWAFSNRSKPPKSLGFWWRGSKSNYNHDQTGNGKDIRVAEMLLGCLFGVLGTRNNLVVKVHYRLGSRNC